jgi:predicted nucleotidyltransferase
MSRQEIHDTIINYLKNYNPARIGVFGSFARGEETEESDLDLLVSFNDSFGLLTLVRIESELSKLLNRKVDLLTEGALKNEKLRKYIQQDLQVIYE